MNLIKWSKRYSPELLTGVGIAGLVITTIMAVKATPKALKLIEKKKQETETEELAPIETVKATWKCYVPSVITGLTSIICIVGANSLNTRRKTALAAAYTISEAALTEYKDKVTQTIGEKKERELREAIIQDKIDNTPVENAKVIVTGKGTTRCFDVFTGRYFDSNIDLIRSAINDLNEQMLNEGTVTLNDFYYLIGLENIRIGDDIGWNAKKGQVRIDFSSHLSSDKTPCLALDFSIEPVYDYYIY